MGFCVEKILRGKISPQDLHCQGLLCNLYRARDQARPLRIEPSEQWGENGLASRLI